MSTKARAYISAIIVAGAALVLWSVLNWQAPAPLRFGLYLTLALIASAMKVRLPGLEATLSPGFVMVLVTASTSNWTETAILSPLAGAMQSLVGAKRRPKWFQIAFNAANLTLAGVLANLFSGALAASAPTEGTGFARLCVALVVLYFFNATTVSVVVCLVQNRPLRTIWRLCNYYSIVGYFVGAVLAWMVLESTTLGWAGTLTVFALVYPLYLFHQSWIEERQSRPA